MPRSKPPVTQKTIADLAKVSPSVVSTVLNGHNGSIRFSEETAERVREAARQLHYRPDRMAQALRTKRHQAIGLLSTGIFSLPHAFLHWLSLALSARDQLLIIQNLPAVDPVAHCQLLRQSFVDAAICPEVPDAAVLRRTAEIGLPLLFVNADPGIPSTRLLFDEAGGMRLAVDHLRRRGYERVVLYELGGSGYWINERRRGCRTAAQASGLPPVRVITMERPGFGPDGVEADRLAAICAPGTGLIVQHSGVLPFLLPRLQARGLEVPREVGVVTLSHPPAMDMDWTFAEINTRLLADAAVELLLTPGKLDGGTCHRAAYDLHPARSTARS